MFIDVGGGFTRSSTELPNVIQWSSYTGAGGPFGALVVAGGTYGSDASDRASLCGLWATLVVLVRLKA